MRNRAEVKIKLTLIRHGLTKLNETHCYVGKTDEPLSEKGVKLLEEKKKANSYPKGDFLFVSPMIRCKQSAEILFPKQSFEVISEFKECDFGSFEGKNYEQLKEDKLYQAWFESNAELPFPNGEDRKAFVDRTYKGFEKMLSIIKEKTAENGVVKVNAVVHGGTIMALLSSFTKGEYFDFQVKNNEGYELSILCCGDEKRIMEFRKI